MECKKALNFCSRRSTLTCLHGCVASTQTLASQIGVDILKQNGNAADAAVAVAAALNVLEPCSTGIGGDAFCLFYKKETNNIQGLNASGRAPQNLTLKHLNSLSFDEDNMFPPTHALSITVPGACAGWVDCVEKFGSGNLSMMEILSPAISLAREGFPVSGPITSYNWNASSLPLLQKNNKFGKELLIKDQKSGLYRAPVTGEIFKNPGLANVFQSVALNGKDGFYKGWVADAIVNVIEEHGGVMTNQDLVDHTSTIVQPIGMEYKGVKLWEIPPNGQGIVALEALNILKNFNFEKLKHNSTDYLHLLIEIIKLSFADALHFCADTILSSVPVEGLLDKEYGKKRSALIDMNKARVACLPGNPPSCTGDTVYFTTADKDGNFCSFINSNYMGFGTGIVPEGCGFSLQNRGFNFSLKEGHSNAVAPGKRPYHTIIPAMVTDVKTGELLMSYGVMGGFMQPQGQIQVLLNMLEFGMDPQEALDAPRFLVGSGHFSPLGTVSLEEGIDQSICCELERLGHDINAAVSGQNRAIFGRGQIAARKNFWNKDNPNSSVLWIGSDPRGDGVACGY